MARVAVAVEVDVEECWYVTHTCVKFNVTDNYVRYLNDSLPQLDSVALSCTAGIPVDTRARVGGCVCLPLRFEPIQDSGLMVCL